MKNKKRERNSTTTITALQCVGIKSKSDLLLLMCDEKKLKNFPIYNYEYCVID